MQIVIRADASFDIGSGHIMRCLVLADALKRKRHQVSFACQPLPGDLISYIKKRGHRVIELNGTRESQRTENIPEGYQSWLQRSQLDDVTDFLARVSHADVVVTDHYAIAEEWQSVAREALGCKVIAIDDLVRSHNAEIIIDQTLGRTASEYKNAAVVLAGSEFALLAPMFAEKREMVLDGHQLQSPVNVLVSMGGVDVPNATLQILNVLIDQDDIFITVLLNSRSPHYQEVVQWSAQYDNVVHHDFTENIADLMQLSDIAIGAPGTTSWERACLGLPRALFPKSLN